MPTGENMRVTYNMMVNNMAYWELQQAEKLNDAGTVVGSGTIVNKPSDNPLAAGEILSYNVSISQYGQYELNITQAQTWIEASNLTLTTVGTFLQNASDTITSYLAGGTDATTSVSELKSYYDQILSLTNSQYTSGVYMYAGNLSNTTPYANEVSISGGTAADIEFGLGGTADDVTITISDSSGTVVRTITGATGTTGTNTIAWDGLDDSSTSLPDDQYSFTVTALNGTDAVAVYPTYRGDTGGKEVITGENESVVLNNNGGDIFSSILSNLSQAITAITNGTSDTGVSTIGDALDQSSTDLEAQQTALSNANAQLDSSNTRLEMLVTYKSDMISYLETGNKDGSTDEAAVKLNLQETNYEEVVAATAKILNMKKLTDYL
jgi:flagellar hook-associated protein 3 FlgL